MSELKQYPKRAGTVNAAIQEVLPGDFFSRVVTRLHHITITVL
jgi:hypothetical protein